MEKFYKGGGGGVSCNVSEKLRLFRKSVVELVGNESTPELLDQTCVELVKMFLGQRKVSSEQIALLKRVQCSVFNIVEKIHKIVEDMTIDIPEESLRSLNLCEENTEEGSYFELSDLCWQTRIPAICKICHNGTFSLESVTSHQKHHQVLYIF